MPYITVYGNRNTSVLNINGADVPVLMSILDTGRGDFPITEELAKRMEGILEEPVRLWKYGKDHVSKIGIVCGGGEGTSLSKTAYENGCDVYITGEKILYTIQYAQFMKKNLIIGTHTFIEMPGVEHMASKLGEKLTDIEFVKIAEEHIEI